MWCLSGKTFPSPLPSWSFYWVFSLPSYFPYNFSIMHVTVQLISIPSSLLSWHSAGKTPGLFIFVPPGPSTVLSSSGHSKNIFWASDMNALPTLDLLLCFFIQSAYYHWFLFNLWSTETSSFLSTMLIRPATYYTLTTEFQAVGLFLVKTRSFQLLPNHLLWP